MRTNGNGKIVAITGASNQKYINGILFSRLAMDFYLISKRYDR